MADPFSDSGSALDGLSSQMDRLDGLTAQFGRTLSRSLAQGIVQGKSFEEVLKGLGDKLIQMSLNSAFRPLESLMGAALGGLTQTATGLLSGTFGGGGGGGLLSAGSPADSRGTKPTAAPGVLVTMNISTPDAASFQRSEAQVSAALARAVARGQRSL